MSDRQPDGVEGGDGNRQPNQRDDGDPEPDQRDDGDPEPDQRDDGDPEPGQQEHRDREPGFVVDGVSKHYGDVTALDGVDLAVQRGQVHGLVGPNGSGKTTLFHLLSGLARPSAGTVSRPDSESVGVGFQQPRFYPDLTVTENLSVFRSFADDPPPAEWTETLQEALRLAPAAHRPGKDLSGGFRTKLDLALAMLRRPDYLLLDEPLADVDDHSRKRIVSFLGEYGTRDRSIVVSTHNVEAFDAILDRVTVLVDGEVEYDGPADGDALDRYRDVLEADSVER